jgi:hypothetical protein
MLNQCSVGSQLSTTFSEAGPEGAKHMTGLPFPWIFIALAAIVDVVGLLYLWRRRNSGMGTSHRAVRGPARSVWIPLMERRRRERRGTGQAAAV